MLLPPLSLPAEVCSPTKLTKGGVQWRCATEASHRVAVLACRFSISLCVPYALLNVTPEAN